MSDTTDETFKLDEATMLRLEEDFKRRLPRQQAFYSKIAITLLAAREKHNASQEAIAELVANMIDNTILVTIRRLASRGI